MPRTNAEGVAAAINSVGDVLHALLAENEALRRQVDGIIRFLRAPRANGAPQRRPGGGGKRGRPFRFNGAQVATFRKQVEGGTSVARLAKQHKVTAATVEAALKRAGWRGRG